MTFLFFDTSGDFNDEINFICRNYIIKPFGCTPAFDFKNN